MVFVRLILVVASFAALALAARLAEGQPAPGGPAGAGSSGAGQFGASPSGGGGFGVQANTQFAAPDVRGTKLGKEVTQRYQIGMLVSAQGGPCTGLYGTAPVPIDWPEQTVQVVTEDTSPAVQKIDYRILGGTVKQMLVSMPFVPPGEEVKALVTLEIRRYSLLPPDDTTIFVIPNKQKLSKEMRLYLTPSPYIESTHTKIRAISKEVLNKHKDATAWEKVEAIYDDIRNRVEYVNGPLKGALKSLQDGNGDCEELSSLFIAVCRASDIPARIVWVPDHCYPEFYLEDREGKGFWFPCQAAGTREFGGITEHRPVLQKGDNFIVPEKPRDRQRYVAEYLTGKGGNPKVKFVRQILETVN